MYQSRYNYVRYRDEGNETEIIDKKLGSFYFPT